MKFFLVLSALLGTCMAQRPTYAGSGPIGRPGLASRFKDQEDSSSTTIRVYNRISEDGTTARIPVDARGDGELVDRLSQWDRDHQPFWLLNADHIEAHRNSQRTQQQNQQNLAVRNGFKDNSESDGWDVQQETRTIRPVQQRSSFLGSRQ